MNYSQAVARLEGFVHYEKHLPRHIDASTFDLEGFSRVLSRLGDPHRKFPVVHVAGTKGKGSTCAILESMLRAHGLRTGLYTSPHLFSYRERIRVDGRWIEEVSFAEAVEGIAAVFDEDFAARAGFRTAFEMLTAAAFLEFAAREVDVAIVETGLGGRLDATNVVRPDVSVLTPVSLDHVPLLGRNTREIARDKMQVLKKGSVAISARQTPSVAAIVRDHCKKMKIALWEEGREGRFSQVYLDPGNIQWDGRFAWDAYEMLLAPLMGRFQVQNATVAILAAKAFLDRQGLPLDQGAMRAGLMSVSWPGRMQMIGRNAIADGAHNAASARSLRQSFRELYGKDTRATMVLGMSRDKDLKGFLRAIAPVCEAVVTTQAKVPRAYPAAELAERVRSLLPKTTVLVRPRLANALRTAKSMAGPEGKVLLTGSLFVVGDALALRKVSPAAQAHQPAQQQI